MTGVQTCALPISAREKLWGLLSLASLLLTLLAFYELARRIMLHNSLNIGAG